MSRARDLSIEERVGQVFMVGFSGTSPEDAAPAIRDLKAGGIIYFARNVGTVEETAALSAALQDMAVQVSAKNLPLLISIDQEGGLVSRLTKGLPGMPGPAALGATGDPGLTEEVSRAIGIQLRAAGINMNLAPVLDVNDNPANPVIGVRSFGGDPDVVVPHGCAAVRGYLSSGVCPVGKHFPGHGNTSVDSHLDLPVLDHGIERLEEVELAPFRAAVAEGLPAIMTAHIVFKALDPKNPATMSAAVLNGLLREKIGFRGLILTDCMEMQAVARYPGTVEASLLAFKAGADLLLISHTLALQEKAYYALLSAVRSGEIGEERLNSSVNRILDLKRKTGLPNPLEPSMANVPEFQDLSRRARQESATVLKAEPDRLPPGRSARHL